MILTKKCLGCPPFLGYICWPKVVGALLLLLAPLALLSFRRAWGHAFISQLRVSKSVVHATTVVSL